jgi:antagonist of KipI
MSLEVIDPGWATRVVDLGRPAARRLGVPVGGAADRRSLVLGNGLVGNPPDAAAVEIGLTGPRLRATAELACVLFGAPFTSNAPRPVGTTFMLQPGDELHVGGTPRGLRMYLCVRGGIQTPPILDSRSGLGPVSRNQVLDCLPGAIPARFAPEIEPRFADEYRLRVLPGLQADWFDEREFYGQSFTVSPAANRMGVRLQGTPLKLPPRELVSEPVSPGAVQVTRDGQCIVLGVDGQTIGGYPKIAHVIRADLDVLGQLRPGNRVTFTIVGQDAAVAADRADADELRRWHLRLVASLDGFARRRRL